MQPGRRGARAHGGKEAQPAAAHRRLLPAARRADAAPLGLTLLAQTREGYGNLSELITLARSRAPGGEYRLAPEDFTDPPPGCAHLRGLPECLAILTPEYGADAARVAEQARWLARVFPRRAWVG